MKTIVTLVTCESASWMEGGRGLLEGVIIGAPRIFPSLNADEKLALAKTLLGENLKKPKTHDFSTVISDDDLTAVQFFDVEEASPEQSTRDMLGEMEWNEDENEGDEDEGDDGEEEDDDD